MILCLYFYVYTSSFHKHHKIFLYLECSDKLDILLILDDSVKTGEENFRKSKDFSKAMLEWFSVDQNNTNVAVMSYSDIAELHMSFPIPGRNTPSQNLYDVQGRIDSIPYKGGSTSRLDRALILASSDVFPEGKQSRNAKKVRNFITNIKLQNFLSLESITF